MKVLVCGGRDYQDIIRLSAVLSSIHNKRPITEIIHGDAHGTDRLAKLYAHRTGTKETAFPADWKTYGKTAGPIRNQQMIDEAKPDLIVAFPGGKGTADMVRRGFAAHIEMMVLT